MSTSGHMSTGGGKSTGGHVSGFLDSAQTYLAKERRVTLTGLVEAMIRETVAGWQF